MGQGGRRGCRSQEVEVDGIIQRLTGVSHGQGHVWDAPAELWPSHSGGYASISGQVPSSIVSTRTMGTRAWLWPANQPPLLSTRLMTLLLPSRSTVSRRRYPARAGVNLVGGHAGHRRVVGSFEKKMPAGEDNPVEVDSGCAIGGGQRPAGEIDGATGVAVRFNPLVGGRCRCAHPGYFRYNNIEWGNGCVCGLVTGRLRLQEGQQYGQEAGGDR